MITHITKILLCGIRWSGWSLRWKLKLVAVCLNKPAWMVRTVSGSAAKLKWKLKKQKIVRNWAKTSKSAPCYFQTVGKKSVSVEQTPVKWKYCWRLDEMTITSQSPFRGSFIVVEHFGKFKRSKLIGENRWRTIYAHNKRWIKRLITFNSIYCYKLFKFI